MSGAKPRLLICTCEKSMPLDAPAIGRACSAHVTLANQLCGVDLAQYKTALAEGQRITIACTQEAPLFKEVAEDLEKPEPDLRQHPRDRRLVEGCRGRCTEDGGADRGQRRRDAAGRAGHARKQRRRADLRPRRRRDRGGRTSRRPARHHRAADETSRRDAAPRQPLSGAQGHRAQRARLPRPVRACHRRLRRAAAVLARQTRLRLAARWRDVELRPDPRSQRRPAAVPRARPAAGLSARRSCRPRRRRTGDCRRGKSRGHLRQAALHPLRTVALRAFALEDHRLHPLPRPVPDRRDHAERRQRRHRSADLRRLRRVRVGLPNGRRRLCAAERRRADATAAHAAADLSRGRRQQRGRPVSRRRPRRSPDRRARTLRRRASRQRASPPRQRSDAARTGDDRRGLRLWRRGCRTADAGQAEARYRRAQAGDRNDRDDRVVARLRRGRRAHHRDRRSGSIARRARRAPLPALRPNGRRASSRAGPSAACSRRRSANCTWRRLRLSMSCRSPRARRSAA